MQQRHSVCALPNRLALIGNLLSYLASITKEKIMNKNHLKGAIATLILAFSPLLVHAEDQGDLRSQHPDARNDRPSEMMRDRVPAVRAKQQIGRASCRER